MNRGCNGAQERLRTRRGAAARGWAEQAGRGVRAGPTTQTSQGGGARRGPQAGRVGEARWAARGGGGGTELGRSADRPTNQTGGAGGAGGGRGGGGGRPTTWAAARTGRASLRGARSVRGPTERSGAGVGQGVALGRAQAGGMRVGR
jgi:hypothetical protein